MKQLFAFPVVLFIALKTFCQVPHVKDSLNISKMAIDTTFSRPYALIAGGSKGIGYALAEAWAKRNYNLILIARHWDSLESAKHKLESAYNIHVELLSYDLSREESAIDIAIWCAERNIPLKVLCNVAGAGGSRDYLSTSLDTLRYMVRLNIESCMALTLTLLPLLEKNSPSYIINVASMAGFAPIPIKNIYSATKSAVIFFSYSLRYQLEEKDISVSCLAPGPVYTKPEIVAETKKQLGKFGDKMARSPERVGEKAVRKTLKGKMMIVPGFLANMMSGILRILPKKTSASIYYRLGKGSY
ncbi:MAG TPA: SDR family NAD(P)-dependent oxidoreductase [Chitinophagaceae bacterium]|nr:SDR family NAD(P)-dependent oxidoreductase [Chitinophagaceae bacterium]